MSKWKLGCVTVFHQPTLTQTAFFANVDCKRHWSDSRPLASAVLAILDSHGISSGIFSYCPGSWKSCSFSSTGQFLNACQQLIDGVDQNPVSGPGWQLSCSVNPLFFTKTTRASSPALPRRGMELTVLPVVTGKGPDLLQWGQLSSAAQRRGAASSFALTPQAPVLPHCPGKGQNELSYAHALLVGSPTEPALLSAVAGTEQCHLTHFQGQLSPTCHRQQGGGILPTSTSLYGQGGLGPTLMPSGPAHLPPPPPGPALLCCAGEEQADCSE